MPVVIALDPKATHNHNLDCPMRLIPTPNGNGWMCFDCGFHIVMQRLEVEEPSTDEPEEQED